MSQLSVTRFAIDGPALIVPKRHGDARGFFAESWNARDWLAAGLPDVKWVQDNEALSAKAGTLRGLHFQTAPQAQAKLVRAVTGAIFDVAVDLRDGSPTYGQAVSAVLSADNGAQLFVPRGFAHGYQTLTDACHVAYKADGYYAPDAEGGLLWNDPALGIDWPKADARTLSDKDTRWPTLSALTPPFRQDGT